MVTVGRVWWDKEEEVRVPGRFSERGGLCCAFRVQYRDTNVGSKVGRACEEER